MWKYEALLTHLIELNKSNQNKGHAVLFSKFNYLKEYCTVRLDIGRGVGKTNYIINNARQGDLVIFNHRYPFESALREDLFDKGVVVILYQKETPSSLLTSVVRRLGQTGKYPRFERIWIDEFSEFEKSDYPDEILALLISLQDKVPTLIGLG